MQNEMRNRLVELLIPFCIKPTPCAVCEYTDLEYCHTYAKADHLIENGVIVLPCKVGDAVWTCLNGYVSKAKVWGISTENYLYEQQIYLKVRVKDKSNFVFDKTLLFGKTVFLTKEEAEQALKGGAEE